MFTSRPTMSPNVVVVLFLSIVQLVCVASNSLNMSPDYLRTSRDPQTVSFTCTSNTALAGCQFRWWGGPLLELSQGSLSQANASHLDSEQLTGYSYSGRGLGAGDCGVSLQVKGLKSWMVACRVRAKTGGWTYAWSDFYAQTYPTIPHTRKPKESVVLLGGEATFMLKAQEPLSKCLFSQPDLVLYFHQGTDSKSITGRHHYLGQGLSNGDCGLTISNVSEADNGLFTSWIYHSAGHQDDTRQMALIVARPPGPPAMSVIYTDAGVTATCEVHEGRPVANISWVLGANVVRQDSLDDSQATAQDEWRWPWMQGSIQQTLTLALSANDNDKVLKCVVSHVTLAQPLVATHIILFDRQ